MRRLALLPVVALVVVLIEWSPTASNAPVPTAFETSVQPFLADHCYDCHDARRHKGNLNLEKFQTTSAVAADPDTWDLVLQKLRTGEMPPEDEIRPEPEDLARITTWIGHEVETADAAAPPRPGHVVLRRLNRAEYNNTIRDLVGVDLRPADEFPQDDTGYGFDTIGAVLTVPPVLMEKYLAASERVAHAAVFGPRPTKPMLDKLTLMSRHITPSVTPLTEYDTTGLSLPNAFHVEYRIAVEADYIINAVAGGTRPAGSEPIELTLWVDGTPRETQSLDPDKAASFEDDQQDFLGKGREFRVHLTAGDALAGCDHPPPVRGTASQLPGPEPVDAPRAAAAALRAALQRAAGGSRQAETEVRGGPQGTPAGQQRPRELPGSRRPVPRRERAIAREPAAHLHLRTCEGTAHGRLPQANRGEPCGARVQASSDGDGSQSLSAAVYRDQGAGRVVRGRHRGGASGAADVAGLPVSPRAAAGGGRHGAPARI